MEIPFGPELAGAVWDRVMKMKPGHGLLEGHPYYCGHGILKAKKGVELAVIEDGRGAQVLKAWEKKADFVAFWAPLTDPACGGADPAQKLFFTADEWERNNQRITRKRLEEFAR